MAFVQGWSLATGDLSQFSSVHTPLSLGSFSVVPETANPIRTQPTIKLIKQGDGAGYCAVTWALLATGFAGFAVNFSAFPSSGSEDFFAFWNGNYKYFVRIRSDGYLLLYANNGTTLTATSSAPLTINTTHYITANHAATNPMTASIGVDGVEVINSSVTTDGGSWSNQLRIGPIVNRSTADYTCQIMNIVRDNDTPPNPNTRFFIATPTGEGFFGPNSTWLAPDGTTQATYDEIDELTHDADSSYMQYVVANASRSFTTEQLTASVASILNVAVRANWKYISGGVPSLRFFVRSETTNGNSGYINNTSTAYVDTWHGVNLNPSGNVAWNLTTANAAQPGIEVSSDVDIARVTNVYKEIAYIADVSAVVQARPKVGGSLVNPLLVNGGLVK